jgi:hypothetical protein
MIGERPHGGEDDPDPKVHRRTLTHLLGKQVQPTPRNTPSLCGVLPVCYPELPRASCPQKQQESGVESIMCFGMSMANACGLRCVDWSQHARNQTWACATQATQPAKRRANKRGALPWHTPAPTHLKPGRTRGVLTCTCNMRRDKGHKHIRAASPITITGTNHRWCMRNKQQSRSIAAAGVLCWRGHTHTLEFPHRKKPPLEGAPRSAAHSAGDFFEVGRLQVDARGRPLTWCTPHTAVWTWRRRKLILSCS